MAIEIDLGQRYRSAFGFTPGNTTDKTRNGGYADGTGNSQAPIYTRGDVAFEEFTLMGNGFKLQFGSGMIDPAGKLGKFFAPPPLMAFRKGKRIIETEIDNSDEGVVVERYTSKPWSINIQGLIIDLDNHLFPSAQLQQLADVFNVNATFEVYGPVFDTFRITTIYFDNEIEFAGVQGFADTWSYNVTAKSMRPVEFFLKKQS